MLDQRTKDYTDDLLMPGLDDIRMDLLDQSRDIESLLDKAVTVYRVLIEQEQAQRKTWEQAKHLLDLTREQVLLAEYAKGKDGALDGRNAEIRSKQETAFLADLPAQNAEYAQLIQAEAYEADKLDSIKLELSDAENRLSAAKYVCRLHSARMEMMKPA